MTDERKKRQRLDCMFLFSGELKSHDWSTIEVRFYQYRFEEHVSHDRCLCNHVFPCFHHFVVEELFQIQQSIMSTPQQPSVLKKDDAGDQSHKRNPDKGSPPPNLQHLQSLMLEIRNGSRNKNRILDEVITILKSLVDVLEEDSSQHAQAESTLKSPSSLQTESTERTGIIKSSKLPTKSLDAGAMPLEILLRHQIAVKLGKSSTHRSEQKSKARKVLRRRKDTRDGLTRAFQWFYDAFN